MSRSVFLHIGAPKTGTTYLQDRLTLNASRLAEQGIHFPTRSPLVSPALFQFRAALDLLEQDWGGPSGHAVGNWDALAKRVRRLDGTVVISHEILAAAPPDKVARAMVDLAGSEVHVVYSARDLGRALPAAWQESIKQGRRWSFATFLRKAQRGTPWFFRAFDIPGVLGTWGGAVPPERMHLVTVPQRPRSGEATTGDPLWLRFCEVFGIDPAWAPADSDRANVSLGVVETNVLRQLNRRLDRKARRKPPYDGLIREVLVENQRVRRPSPPVRLPPSHFDWLEETTERWIEYLQQSGVRIVGDLADLRPERPDPDEQWQNPDRVPPRKRMQASLDALAAMTDEAAARRGPDDRLTTKIRKSAGRLRGRR
ncbi:MAG: hypothetical protein ACRDOM_06485 [Nocardioides sp.]